MLSTRVSRFKSDERGATAIEYGLIAFLISIMLIAGAQLIGPAVKNLFDHAASGTTLAETTAGL